MDYTLAPLTSSQTRRMLECAVDPVQACAIQSSDILNALHNAAATDKKGDSITEILEDMAGRREAVLICNLAADDSSAKIDVYLSVHKPELIAIGLALLAKAGNCEEVLIYAPEGFATSGVSDVLSNIFKDKVSVASGPESQVLREDTALYSALDKGEVWPDPEGHAYLQQFSSEGRQNRPTLVVDGETACNICCLLLHPEALQTKLMVIRSTEPMLAEVKVGAPLVTLLSELQLTLEKAPLLGGLSGRFVSAQELDGLQVGFNRLFDSLTLYAKSDCMAAECARLMQASNELSCGKCVMCREGSFQLRWIFSSIVEGKAKRDDIALAEDIAPLIALGSLCGFGKAMPGPAISAITLHRGEIEAHVIRKSCPAGKCAAFLDYVIDPSLCTGCGECMDACEDDAIEGRKGYIYMIDPKACIKCGKCREVCPENAVLIGADIRVPRKLTKVGMFGF